MDQLRRFRNNTPYVIAVVLAIAAVMAWGSQSWVTVMLFPVSALVGGTIGLLIAVPYQRRDFRAILPKSRGGYGLKQRSPNVPFGLVLVGFGIIHVLVRTYGLPVELGVAANVLVGVSACLVVPWIDARRPEYPFDAPSRRRPRRH